MLITLIIGKQTILTILLIVLSNTLIGCDTYNAAKDKSTVDLICAGDSGMRIEDFRRLGAVCKETAVNCCSNETSDYILGDLRAQW